MKVNDLRVGNFVSLVDKGIYTVYGLGKDAEDPDCSFVVVSISDKVLHEYDIEDVHPVLLTEEFILKFGFEPKNKSVFTNKSFTNNGYSIYPEKIGFSFWFEQSVEQDVCARDIEFVHDLQNLWHVLTGKELEIK